MRGEFEKLPEIAELVNDFDFSEDTNTYHIRYDDMDDDRKRLDVMYLGGAWYAYQEQQKKINKAVDYLDSIEGLVWYEQIKELLK